MNENDANTDHEHIMFDDGLICTKNNKNKYAIMP